MKIVKLLLPNILTVCGLVCTSVNLYVLGFNWNLWLFLILLNLAIIFDFLDGIIARHLQVTSKFGAILDSIHDVMLYLILPTFYFFQNFGQSISSNVLINIAFWSLFIILLTSGCVRLVRYTLGNGIYKSEGKNYYIGLPVIYSLLLLPLTNLLQIIPFNTAFVIFIAYIINIIVLMPSELKILKFQTSFVLLKLVFLNLLFLLTNYAK